MASKYYEGATSTRAWLASIVSAVARPRIVVGVDAVVIVPVLVLDHSSMDLTSFVFQHGRMHAQGIFDVLVVVRAKRSRRVAVHVILGREGVELPLVGLVMANRCACAGEVERGAGSCGLHLVHDRAGRVAMGGSEGVGVAAGCEESHVDAGLVMCAGRGTCHRTRRRDEHRVLREGRDRGRPELVAGTAVVGDFIPSLRLYRFFGLLLGDTIGFSGRSSSSPTLTGFGA